MRPTLTPTVSDRELRVLVNGEDRRIPAGCTVEALIRLLEISPQRLAVAVNREVVPRSAYASHRLAAGDRVEILEAVGGG